MLLCLFHNATQSSSLINGQWQPIPVLHRPRDHRQQAGCSLSGSVALRQLRPTSTLPHGLKCRPILPPAPLPFSSPTSRLALPPPPVRSRPAPSCAVALRSNGATFAQRRGSKAKEAISEVSSSPLQSSKREPEVLQVQAQASPGLRDVGEAALISATPLNLGV